MTSSTSGGELGQVPVQFAPDPQPALASIREHSAIERVDEPEVVERLGRSSRPIRRTSSRLRSAVAAISVSAPRPARRPRRPPARRAGRSRSASGRPLVELACDPRPLALLGGEDPPAALEPLPSSRSSIAFERAGERRTSRPAPSKAPTRRSGRPGSTARHQRRQPPQRANSRRSSTRSIASITTNPIDRRPARSASRPDGR